MSSKPLLVDLYCGAGGISVGYHQAGFRIIGVDKNPQPNYPFEFVQHDVLANAGNDIRELLTIADAAHASPPCQAHTSMRHAPNARKHVSLIARTRKLLKEANLPWVIENVVGAPLIEPITLCGSMFDLQTEGFFLRRHRLFESNQTIRPPRPCSHQGPTIGVYGGHVRCRGSKHWRNGGADFPGRDKKKLAMSAMGIEHPMTMAEISEAIPPAYSRHIGHQLMNVL